MAPCLDVVHLEDTIDLKTQGSLRYHMFSAVLAILHMFHALHILCATLFPFALLWWNVMLHATCAKYYSWNRSLLRQQTSGLRFCGTIMRIWCPFSDVSIAEDRLSHHQRGSVAESSYAETGEISIFSLLQQATCAGDVATISLDHRQSHCPNRGFGVSIQSCPHQNVLHKLDQYGNVADAWLKNSGLQFREQISCRTTSLASNDLLVATPSSASKLSFQCFVEGGQPQPSVLLKGGVVSAFLPHQENLLAMLDVHVCPLISLEHLYLHVDLQRNRNMVDLKALVLIDHVYSNWPMLREWLEMLYRGCVPAFNSGKKYLDLAGNSSKILVSQTRNDDYARLRLMLSITEGFDIFNATSSHDTAEISELRTREHWSSSDTSSFKMTRSITFMDNKGSGSDCSEDLSSVCSASIKLNSGCDGTYRIDAESTSDSDDIFDDSGVVHGEQCFEDDGYCDNCYRRYEDRGAEDAEHVYGNLTHRAIDEEDSFSDCSADCSVGLDGLHCVTDVDGFCGTYYDVSDGNYDNLEGNVEGLDLVCGGFQFAYEDGDDENPLEIRRIHVDESHTWWDDDVVFVAKQENEEDSIEQEWQVV